MDAFFKLCKYMVVLQCFAMLGCDGSGVTVKNTGHGNVSTGGQRGGQSGSGQVNGGAINGTPQLSVSDIVIEGTDAFSFRQDSGTRSDKVIGLFEFVLKDETNTRLVRGLDNSNMSFRERRFGSEEEFLVDVEATQSSGLEVTQIDVMYLIDSSFSVVQAGANAELIQQANNLANEINKRNSATGSLSNETRFRTFADDIGSLQTGNSTDPFGAIAFEERGGGTALYQGIELALNDLTASSQPVLFVFTDGRENASRPGYNLDLVLATAQQNNIPVYIAGLGNVDAAILNQIATTSGGQFFQADSVDQLAQVFEDVLFSIPVEYTVSYRPTHRTGHIEFQFVVDYNGATDYVMGDFNVDEILSN